MYTGIARNWTDGSSHQHAQQQITSSDGLMYSGSRAPPMEQRTTSFDNSLRTESGVLPPKDQIQSIPSYPIQMYNALDKWLEEPPKSGPYNNIQSFAWTEREEPDADSGKVGEHYMVDKRSVGYYDPQK
jgi:hypothetical protein